MPPNKHGRPPSRVPHVDAEQLLRSLGLEGAAEPASVLDSIRKLRGVRQQGVLDNGAAVAAHLLSPAVGLTAQQAGQLVVGCPKLFSWPPQQRAAVLFGELMAAGLSAAEAAACFLAYPAAAERTSLAAGLAELAAILAHSQDPDSSQTGPKPLPAAQRTVAALLRKKPSSVQLACNRAGYLQQRAAELQQAGHSPAGVAALAWRQPALLWMDGAAKVSQMSAVLQQELGLTAAQLDSLLARRPPRWLAGSRDTVTERVAALAEVRRCAPLGHAFAIACRHWCWYLCSGRLAHPLRWPRWAHLGLGCSLPLALLTACGHSQ